jgi:hypothetical protein
VTATDQCVALIDLLNAESADDWILKILTRLSGETLARDGRP